MTTNARTVAATKLQDFVNKRVQEGNAIVRLHDREASAVIDAISLAVIEAIQNAFMDEPQGGTPARRETG